MIKVGYSRVFAAGEPPLTGLLLWLKSDSIVGVSDGGNLGDNGIGGGPGWTSSDGAATHFRNRVGAAFGTYETTPNINGVPIVKFDQSAWGGFPIAFCLTGEGNLATIEALTGTNGATVYAVAQMNTSNPPAGTQGLWTITERDPGFSFWSQGWHTDGHMYDCTFTNAMKDLGVLNLANPFCYGIFSKTNQYTCRFNGAQVFNTGTNTFRNSTGQPLMLGGATTGGGAIYGNFNAAEWLVYDHVLDADEIATLEDYLLTKYGI